MTSFFKCRGSVGTMNFQPGKDGKAKSYQVRQVLKIHDDLESSPEER